MGLFNFKTLVAAVLMLACVAPTMAADNSPVGTWKSSTGESHYEFVMCGDGTQLCAKLVYLRKDALSAETKPYLGTYLVNGAKQTKSNEWRGDVHLFDKTAGGTFTLISAKRMKLEGCYLVFCKSFDLVRIQ